MSLSDLGPVFESEIVPVSIQDSDEYLIWDWNYNLTLEWGQV